MVATAHLLARLEGQRGEQRRVGLLEDREGHREVVHLEDGDVAVQRRERRRRGDVEGVVAAVVVEVVADRGEDGGEELEWGFDAAGDLGMRREQPVGAVRHARAVRRVVVWHVAVL